jgi:hypothetical protein
MVSFRPVLVMKNLLQTIGSYSRLWDTTIAQRLHNQSNRQKTTRTRRGTRSTIDPVVTLRHPHRASTFAERALSASDSAQQ